MATSADKWGETSAKCEESSPSVLSGCSVRAACSDPAVLHCEPGNGMILRTTSRVYKHIHILIKGERFDECSDLQHRRQSALHAAFKHSQVIPSAGWLLAERGFSNWLRGSGSRFVIIFCRLKYPGSCFQISFVLFQRILFAIANNIIVSNRNLTPLVINLYRKY